MDIFSIVLTVLLVIAAILAVVYFVGKRLQKKQAESQTLIDQNRQTITAYIIDKKKAKISEANMPKAVMEQVPKYMKLVKMPLVKVKVGPQIITMFCDKQVFNDLPVKKNIKLEISGGYIMGFSTGKKGEKAPEYEKKLTFRQKLSQKLADYQAKANAPAETKKK